MIHVTCYECGHRYKGEDSQANSTFFCTECGARVLVPTPQRMNKGEKVAIVIAVASVLALIAFIAPAIWLVFDWNARMPAPMERFYAWVGSFGHVKVDEWPANSTRWCCYEVSGTTRKATVTYLKGGATEQREIEIPWSSSSFVAQRGDVLVCSAQNAAASGSITTKIFLGDRVLKQATSEGAYVIASVDTVTP